MAKNRTKIAHILSGDILSKGVAFFITIYLTRVFGKEGYGMVTVAMAYLGYASFFADFGLFNIGTREVAKTFAKRIFQPFEILVARMFLATLIFGIVWLALPFILTDTEQLILTRRFLFSLLVHAYLVEWYFNGLQRYDLIAFSRTLQMAVYGLGVFIFIKSSSDILYLPIFYIFGLLISAIILLSIAFNDKAFTYSKKRINLYKKLVKSSSSVGSGLLFSNVIQLLPPITISYFLSTADAGLFGAAYKMIMIGMLLDRLFVQLLIPNLASQWSIDKVRTITNMEHTSRIMLTIGGTISLFIAIGATYLSTFLFGADFIHSAPIITSLCLYLFFTFQNSMFSHGLLSIGKDIEFFKATSYSGILAIALIVISSMYFDSIIVGISVAISEFIIAALCYFWFNKSVSFPFIKPFISTLIIGLAIYIGSAFIDLQTILKAVLAPIVFVITLFVFRILRIKDLQWLKMVLLK